MTVLDYHNLPLKDVANRMPTETNSLLDKLGSKWTYSVAINDVYFENATAAFGQAKRLIRAGARRAFAENLDDEARTIGARFDTPESKARVAAFAAASRRSTKE